MNLKVGGSSIYRPCIGGFNVVPMKKRTGKIVIIIVSILVVAGLALAGAGYYLWKQPAVVKDGNIYVETGTGYDGLMERLTGEGYITDRSRFDLFSRILKTGGQVRPGHYRLRKGMGYPELVRMFQRGFQAPVKVTYNNIRLLPQLAGRVSRQLEADSLEFLQVMTADTTATHYGFGSDEFLAMFIPDTYEMYWTSSPQTFLDRMKREYDNFWTGERDRKRKALGLSRSEVITLASIVFEETKKPDEMPRVAGVYINRLRIGMPLQADPTVKFAVGDFTLRRILTRHTWIDHPYNTYYYPGLPPGPICMPSVTAIDAVLDYEHHDYLYFCARADFSGYHSFVRTLAEHNRNRDLWVAALNRAGIR